MRMRRTAENNFTGNMLKKAVDEVWGKYKVINLDKSKHIG